MICKANGRQPRHRDTLCSKRATAVARPPHVTLIRDPDGVAAARMLFNIAGQRVCVAYWTPVLGPKRAPFVLPALGVPISEAGIFRRVLMSALVPLVLIILVSFGCGYGVRALMSRRRRAAERQRRGYGRRGLEHRP